MFEFTSQRIRQMMAAAVVTAISATALSAQDIRIGAMREGSSWYIFAATLEQMIEPILGDNSVEIIARGGGVANPMVVQTGKAEIALSNVASAVWAANGDDVYQGMKAPDIRALVGGLNDVYVGVMATKAFVEKQGTTDLAEIVASGAPIRVLIKPVGSSAVPVAYMIMEGLGTSPEQIKANGGDIIQVDTGQIADQMRNGNADIYIDTMIKGHPAITEVALTSDVTFLDIPQPAMDVLEAHGLRPGSYGPDWYKGQTSATTGANLGTVLIANASLDEQTAYLITKTIIENADALKASHGAWASFDPAQAMLPANVGIELHPGALRYYEEAGLM
ncbi:TAXI family TRAP transporter solute-binding subunit [Pseudooceanicola sediminis]|uniref:TAXI family TRAP transporter solute-binding subunit n=1 Tax=Pseudooceanicola sediminis TaxID=2211117 RepID=A0A399IXA8_9RHOB|nr:TAXI family TRAP transporter solute-binding subunit [Pseudooceanicola sediminis]KAA2311563.1 TAXI family TRAP transporter solute-binding subunit [Puniceibacterium sp. HSS470]RII37067.1 TAXI family TRAP transporter solute-binding subunit [Pseudooceanicola sediminis]|tara:strand:- start:12765 stop:13766 length:1002 start_codon:yes stop_codon:yes gene_type:complete